MISDIVTQRSTKATLRTGLQRGYLHYLLYRTTQKPSPSNLWPLLCLPHTCPGPLTRRSLIISICSNSHNKHSTLTTLRSLPQWVGEDHCRMAHHRAPATTPTA